jgi:hypothetical protein
MEVSRKNIALFFLLGAVFLVSSCINLTSDKAREPYNGIPRTPFVSWTANRERLVNSIGGGYRVYYSSVPTFNIANAAHVDVPYVNGPLAPTSTTLPDNLGTGTFYIKIVAYSAAFTSNPSSQISVTIR